MHADILNALRCPKTGDTLTHHPAEGDLPERLHSAAAQAWYPIRDGIPALLIEHAVADSA